MKRFVAECFLEYAVKVGRIPLGQCIMIMLFSKAKKIYDFLR